MSRKTVIAALCAILIFYGVIALSVYVNVENVPFPVLNNPGKAAEFSFAIDYPPQDPGVTNIENIALHLDITLTAKNPDAALSAGEPIIVNASGFTLNKMPINSNYFIRNITIDFEGAYPLPASSQSANESAGITIFNNTDIKPNDEALNASRLPVIYWPAEGSYYPTITINFENSSGFTVRTVVQSYSNHLISMGPNSVSQAGRFFRVEVALALALVSFALLAGIGIYKRAASGA